MYKGVEQHAVVVSRHPLPVEPGVAPVSPVDTGLKEDFGLSYLYPYQRLVVTNVLESVAAAKGKGTPGEDGPGDQIVVLPTGAGKSLCFQLPAVLLDGVTVVVYPLLSLMADQYRSLNKKGLGAVMLRGGQTKAERQKSFGRLESSTAKIIITNPETLANEDLSKRIAGLGVDHLVIDEAHCISEWGETFRPTYLNLGAAKEALGAAVCTAFTATASPPIMAGIVKHLFAGLKPHVIAGNPDRTNIRYFTVPSICTAATLVELFQGVEKTGDDTSAPEPDDEPDSVNRKPDPSGGWRPGLPVRTPAIVFCRSRDGASLTALELRRRLGRRDIYFYHAGLSKPEKTQIEEWFFDSKTGILCATCAYGMGVDKSDIRTVIHFETPPSIEAYLQESGRAGRDRSPADAILVYTPQAGPAHTITAGGPKAGGYRRSASTVPAATGVPVITASSGPADRFAAMEAYPYLTGCRREYLVSLLGGEVEHCGGCDVCLGFGDKSPTGEAEILAAVRQYQRCFTRSVLGRFLQSAGFLGQWENEDIDEALRSLIAEGSLRVSSRILWKRRLYAPILHDNDRQSQRERRAAWLTRRQSRSLRRAYRDFAG